MLKDSLWEFPVGEDFSLYFYFGFLKDSPDQKTLLDFGLPLPVQVSEVQITAYILPGDKSDLRHRKPSPLCLERGSLGEKGCTGSGVTRARVGPWQAGQQLLCDSCCFLGCTSCFIY